MSLPVCLIVGAGDYIGAAIARRFAEGGYTVCLGRRHGEKSAALVEEIEAQGVSAFAYSLDAREETQIQQRFAAIENDIGPLQVVISNPGGNVNFPIRETTERVFRKVWMMACLTGFLTGREAARYMVPAARDRSSSPGPRPVCVAALALPPSPALNSPCVDWPRAWPGNSGLRAYTWLI